MGYKCFDENALRESFVGDEEILNDLILEFLGRIPAMLAEIKVAIEHKNATDLRLHAHTLKGVISNFYAEEIKEICYSLENDGAGNNFSNSIAKFQQLEEQMQIFLIEIKNFQQTII